MEAKKLSADILTWRPRWGEAISTLGFLKSIEANTKRRNDPVAVTLREKAIEEIRRVFRRRSAAANSISTR